MTWLAYEGNELRDVPLVAECEWNARIEWIDEDFQKLLLARADVRVMVFTGTNAKRSREVAGHLAAQVGRFRRALDDDTWLLASWEASDEDARGWMFRRFAVREGTEQELEAVLCSDVTRRGSVLNWDGTHPRGTYICEDCRIGRRGEK